MGDSSCDTEVEDSTRLSLTGAFHYTSPPLQLYRIMILLMKRLRKRVSKQCAWGYMS